MDLTDADMFHGDLESFVIVLAGGDNICCADQVLSLASKNVPVDKYHYWTLNVLMTEWWQDG